jgi:hypothetical protein
LLIAPPKLIAIKRRQAEASAAETSAKEKIVMNG